MKFPLAIIVIMMTGFLSSCIMKDDYADCPPKKGLKIISSINFEGNSSFLPKGSSIGVSLLKSGTNECFGGNSDRHYIISDTQTGESLPKKDENTIYLPEDNSLVDAIAYYPYTIHFDNKYQARLSVFDQSKLDSLDLITSDRVCNISGDVEQIELNFCRRLTKLTFDITLIEVDADGNETVINHKLPGTTLDITGMPVSGNYSLPDNLLTVSGDTSTISTLINKEGTKSEAIVFPREPGEGVAFVVTFPDGSKHSFEMDPEQALKAGTQNEFEILIRVKQDVPEEPEYKITYELQGALNTGNIIVSQGSGNTLWGLNQTVVVKQNSDFSFLYNSALSVTARLSDDTVLDTKNNTSYLFTDIHKDIHIILSAEDTPEPPIPPIPGSYKVTYELQGDLTAYNISLKQNGNVWTVGEVITVEEGSNFSFLYNSALEVVVRLADGTGLNMSNNRSYSFTDIHKDIHVILSSKDIPEPPAPPVYYKMTYEYEEGGTLTPENTKVTGNGKEWEMNGIISVISGGRFTIQYDKSQDNTSPVTVFMNEKVVEDIEDGNAKVYTGIHQNMHFVLYGKKLHVVTVITNLPDIQISEINTKVLEGGELEISIPDGVTDLIVKMDGKIIDHSNIVDGKYILKNVTKDSVITITKSKGVNNPDFIIKADVHPWIVLDPIDGGIITPDK